MSRERERIDEIGKKIKREADHVYVGSNINRRQIMLGSSTPSQLVGTSLNTITPCAACKLLRRRCAQECPFSPYFSPHEPHKFSSVHKVFGASNVSKMLLEVPESQRADAANSLVYEANVRLRDPVYGCMGAISALQQQLQSLQAELNLVRAEILKYKYREAEANLNSIIPSISHHPDFLALPPVGSASTIATALPLSPQPSPPTPPPPPPLPPLNLSSSSSSMYTTQLSTGGVDYSTITSENVAYFG